MELVTLALIIALELIVTFPSDGKIGPVSPTLKVLCRFVFRPEPGLIRDSRMPPGRPKTSQWHADC
jgi:hypothetical protein